MINKNKLTEKVDISNIPAFTEKSIKNKMNKKSRIGNKINKYNKDLDVNYYERNKMIEKANKNGYYSLSLFTKVYKRQVLVSYSYYFKYFNLYPQFLSYLVKNGIIEIYENPAKNLECNENKKFFRSYRIPLNKVDEMIKFTRKNLLSEYQINVFIKKIV